MAANTTIEWTDVTWNPIRGCSVISPGCVNCYAMKQAHRFSGKGRAYEGLTKQTKAGPQWTGKVMLVEKHLLDPLKWREPKRVFVNSMADLFHESVPDEWIDRIFAVMALAQQHTFQILTKRADRMRAYMTAERRPDAWSEAAEYLDLAEAQWNEIAERERSEGAWFTEGTMLYNAVDNVTDSGTKPLDNVWLGVSVEDRKHLDRVDDLKDTPAAVRFISFEPLLEYLGSMNLSAIHWAIVGGESGLGARPFNVMWARSIVEKCQRQGVACFVKQLGAYVVDRNDSDFDGSHDMAWPVDIEQRDAVEDHINGYREDYQGAPVRVRLIDRKGGDINEWPADLRVREFPRVPA